jgi:SRSO17 transposase
VSNILSTQLNYNPFMLTMTQANDTKKLIISNSIVNTNSFINEYNSLLYNDIMYNWIDYTSSVVADLIVNKGRVFKLNVIDRQVEYPNNLLKVKYSKFYKINHKL